MSLSEGSDVTECVNVSLKSDRGCEYLYDVTKSVSVFLYMM